MSHKCIHIQSLLSRSNWDNMVRNLRNFSVLIRRHLNVFCASQSLGEGWVPFVLQQILQVIYDSRKTFRVKKPAQWAAPVVTRAFRLRQWQATMNKLLRNAKSNSYALNLMVVFPVTLNDPHITPFSTFCIAFRIFVVGSAGLRWVLLMLQH